MRVYEFDGLGYPQAIVLEGRQGVQEGGVIGIFRESLDYFSCRVWCVL